MRVIIAGSRSIKLTVKELDKIIQRSPFHPLIKEIHEQLQSKVIKEVVCGGAKGPDTIGGQWAFSNGIPVKTMWPDWDKGPQAGIVRNAEMADYASQDPAGGGLIAVWDGKSPGTRHMITTAQAKGLTTFVWLWA